jgi:hypothetical protein
VLWLCIDPSVYGVVLVIWVFRRLFKKANWGFRDKESMDCVMNLSCCHSILLRVHRRRHAVFPLEVLVPMFTLFSHNQSHILLGWRFVVTKDHGLLETLS